MLEEDCAETVGCVRVVQCCVEVVVGYDVIDCAEI